MSSDTPHRDETEFLPAEEATAAAVGAEAIRAVRAIMALMGEGAAILDAKGRVLHCNAPLAETLRRPADEFLGWPFSQLVSPEDRGMWRAAFAGRTE
ncbi:unnamed protein product, partial [marine sediment metagenome]